MTHFIFKILGQLVNFSMSRALLISLRSRIVLISEKGRLSFFATTVESHLRIEDNTGSRGRNKLVFINPFEVPNKALLCQYSTKATFFCLNLHECRGVERFLKKLIWDLLRCIARDNSFVVMGSVNLAPDKAFFWDHCPPVLREIAKIDRSSREFSRLEESIDLNKPFCLLSFRREDYYKKYVSESRNIQAQPSFSFRNPLFKDFIPLIEEFTERTIQVILMGLPSHEVGYVRSGFYDFSGTGYSPEIDLFLASRCLFLINGSCGYHYMAKIFNKPILMTHSYDPRAGFLGLHGSVLPSKYQLHGRDLSLRASMEIPLDRPLTDGYSLIPPTKEEILMSGIDFLDNLWEYQNFFVRQPERAYQLASELGLKGRICFSTPWLKRNLHLFA